MPELPEVETVKRILEREVIGKTIEDIEIYRAKNVVTGADEFAKTLKGKKIEAMSRVGKFLVFHLSEGHVIVSHLRMEGKYYAGKKEDPVEKHEILRFLFADGTRLSYLDTRKFGVLYLEREDDYLAKAPLTEVGTEPWSTDPSALLKAYRRKKGPLKEALLQQYREGRIVAAICAAPLVLGGLGLTKGRRATCYPGFEDALIGATTCGANVETDGNVITGKGPGLVFDFGLALVKAIKGEAVAEEVAAGMLLA